MGTMKNFTKILRENRGMTLIEITIVMAILAFIFGIVGNSIAKNQRRAKVQQTKIIIGDVVKALDQFNTDCGFYPTADQGLLALASTPASGKQCQNWGPEPYMKKVPKDAWGNDLVYIPDQSGSKYVVKSLGADGKEGGSGYDTDLSSEDL